MLNGYATGLSLLSLVRKGIHNTLQPVKTRSLASPSLTLYNQECHRDRPVSKLSPRKKGPIRKKQIRS